MTATVGVTVGLDVMLTTGATYRQIDHWTRLGWLDPVPGTGGGTGHRRRWTSAEQAVAATMARLVAPAVGLAPAAAARVARAGGRCELAPGVVVTVDDAQDATHTTFRDTPKVTADQVAGMIRDIFAADPDTAPAATAVT